MTEPASTGGGAHRRLHGLLPAELASTIPPLYSTEHIEDPEAKAKWFTPWSNWTWYAVEYDGEDRCFGLVAGHEVELGYFLLSELASIEGPAPGGSLKIERDRHFSPVRISALRERHR
jgi:hypothetical protein